jgi:uncharacterized protein YjbI with pentapeptide repeats
MMLEGDPTIVATTDATGAFTFADVPTGAYLLVPSLIDYTFNPASWLIDVSTADVTGLDFTAALNPTARIISGNVTGAATAGVTVTLAGPTSGTTTSDAAGNFAFDGLGDGTYLVTPSLAGFVFTPSDCLVTVAGPSVTSVEFTSVVTPHSISGTVSPATAGVSVVLFMDAQTSGTTAAADAQVVTSTTTAADGSYTFTGLENGSFVVVPALWGYYFSPAGAAVTLAGADVAGVDFIIAPSHVISGHVSGDVISGVAVNLSGAANGKATTDVTGYYAFGDLPNGNYVLTPSAAGYSFAPQFLATSLSGADLTTANFTSTLVPVYSVTGKVSGVTVSGVTVTLSDPASIATTDGTGTYTFSGLPNGSYLVIPSARGDAFTPASRAFRINGASVTGQDFTSAVAP